MSTHRFIRVSEAKQRLARSHTQIYRDIGDGVLPPPVKIGPRCVAFIEAELDAVSSYRIAGKSADEIKKLVVDLIAARQQAA